MVYGQQPYLTMCSGSGQTFPADENTPGYLSPSAKVVEDPSPFWAPPVPNKSKLGEMSGIAVAEDSSLWGLYR